MHTPGPSRNPPSEARSHANGHLILVGASVRAAAESARRAGFSATAIDDFGDRDTLACTRRWIPLADLRAKNHWNAFDAEQTPPPRIAIVGGLQHGYDWIRADETRFLGLAPAWFARCDQPDFLRDLARHAGIHFPQTQPFPQRKSGPVEPGWLIKSLASSGGLGVRLQRDAERGGPPNGLDGQPTTAYLQRRLRGRVYGISYVGLGDRALLVGGCRLITRRIGELPFVFAGALGPLRIPPAIRSRLEKLGTEFVCRSRITGPFNADVVIHRDSVWLLEINPRWSASMEIVERAWATALDRPVSWFDRSLVESALLEDALHDGSQHDSVSLPQKTGGPLPVFIKRILFAGRPIRIAPSDFDIRFADDRWDWKDVPARPTTIHRHHPVATLIARLDHLSLRQAFRVKFPADLQGLIYRSNPTGVL